MHKIVYYRPHEFFWFEMFSGTASLTWGTYVYLKDIPLDQEAAYSILSTYISGQVWYIVAMTCGFLQALFTAIPCFIDAPLYLVRKATIMRFINAWIMLVWWEVLGTALLKDAWAPMATIAFMAGVFQVPIVAKLHVGLLAAYKK